LAKDGYVSELAIKEKEREAIEKEQDLKAQKSNAQSLRSAIAISEKRLASIRSQYRSQLENERLETVGTLNKSGQELEKSNVKAGMLDGEVASLSADSADPKQTPQGQQPTLTYGAIVKLNS
jgi:hemolysin D